MLSIQEIINPGQSAVNELKSSTSMNSQIRSLSPSEISSIPIKLTLTELDSYGFSYAIPNGKAEICSFCSEPMSLIGRRSMVKNTVFSWEYVCNCEGYIKNQELLKKDEARKEDEKKELENQEALKKKVSRLFNQSKLGKRFQTRTFENFKTNETNIKAFRSVVKYSEKFLDYKNTGIGFIISGPYGVGKTHLAGALAIELINRGVPVMFGTLISLLGAIRQTYSENWTQDDEISIMDTYSRVDLLIIDDLGKERVSDWTLEKLFSIVNQRYENCLPLVVTTNYTTETLIKRLTVNGNSDVAESIVSRLNEMCKGVYLGGPDQRY